jgi:hypothetical protein
VLAATVHVDWVVAGVARVWSSSAADDDACFLPPSILCTGLLANTWGVHDTTYRHFSNPSIKLTCTALQYTSCLAPPQLTVPLANRNADLLQTRLQDITAGASSLANLSAYLTLQRAEEMYGFEPAKFGLSEAQAADIAGVFSRFDTNEDGRLEQSELRRLW